MRVEYVVSLSAIVNDLVFIHCIHTMTRGSLASTREFEYYKRRIYEYIYITRGPGVALT